MVTNYGDQSEASDSVTAFELAIVIVGTEVLRYANSLGLPKFIGEYVAARHVIFFIWDTVLHALG